MRRLVFLDTAGLLVLGDADDPNHSKVMAMVSSMVSDGVQFVSSDYIVSELLTLLRCKEKFPIKMVMAFVQSLGQLNIDLVSISRELFGESLELMQKYCDQYFSFVDCVSFQIMEDMKIKDVLTTDKHFAAAGFNVLI